MDASVAKSAHTPARSALELIGRVAAVTGSQATVELSSRSVGGEHPTVGKFMGMVAGKAVIIGLVTDIGEQAMVAPAGHAAFLSKCPACGSRRSDIVWNSERKRLIRGCRRCGAIKPEQPRVPASAWDFVGRDIELIGDRKEDIREQLARANAPIMPKKDQKAETVN